MREARRWTVALLVGLIGLTAAGTAYAQCNQSIECEFNGTLAVRRGAALLTISTPGELEVGNFGSLNLIYGVEFFMLPGQDSGTPDPEGQGPNPEGQSGTGGSLDSHHGHGSETQVPHDSHDEWIEMGIVAFKQIESVADSETGAFLEFFSVVNKETTAGGDPTTSTLAFHRFVDAGNVAEVTTEFEKFTSTTLTYEIYNAGVSVTSTTGQSTDSIATVADWPDRHAYSEIKWNQPISITIPNGVGTVNAMGDELRIHPDDHVETVRNTAKHGWNARGVNATAAFAGGGPVESLTIIEVSMPTGPPPPVPSPQVPALTGRGLVVLLAAMGLAMVFAARRRIVG